MPPELTASTSVRAGGSADCQCFLVRDTDQSVRMCFRHFIVTSTWRRRSGTSLDYERPRGPSATSGNRRARWCRPARRRSASGCDVGHCGSGALAHLQPCHVVGQQQVRDQDVQLVPGDAQRWWADRMERELIVLAAPPATAQHAPLSANRRKSSGNLCRSTPPATHSPAAQPSNNSLHRLNSNQSAHLLPSNPHSTCGTAWRSLKRGFLPCRLSDAGRRIRGPLPQAAGIRNPSQEETPQAGPDITRHHLRPEARSLPSGRRQRLPLL